jgi:retron-type reverse transcriptase
MSAGQWHYQQRRLRRQHQLGHNGAPLTVKQILDRDNFFDCYRELSRTGGEAPGPDGITYTDLSPHEVGQIMGKLSQVMLDGTYRPQPPRPVDIPKAGGGTRTLHLGNLLDRVLGKVLANALEPFWEQVFLPCSWGFRPGRSAWKMLAHLETLMVASGRRVLVVDDIKTAFDTVPLEETIQCHERLFETINKRKDFNNEERARLLALVNNLLRGAFSNRQRGIAQGGPYSPMALNALLHTYLDVPISKDVRQTPFWFRYADNLVYLAQDASEGRQILELVRQRLKPLGLVLKDEDGGVVDLAEGGAAQLLGFELRLDGNRLQYDLGRKAWIQLNQHLVEAHEHQDPYLAARQTLMGWINAYGPTFESGDPEEVLRIAANHGFRELARLEDLHQQWHSSWTRWQRCRREALHRGIPPSIARGSAAATTGSVMDPRPSSCAQ